MSQVEHMTRGAGGSSRGALTVMVLAVAVAVVVRVMTAVTLMTVSVLMEVWWGWW